MYASKSALLKELSKLQTKARKTCNYNVTRIESQTYSHKKQCQLASTGGFYTEARHPMQ
jgi:hypothetical protein